MKKITLLAIILSILLILSMIYTTYIQTINFKINNKLDIQNNKIKKLNSEYLTEKNNNNNLTKINKNNSLFINTYFISLSKFYNAIDIEETASAKYDLACIYYEEEKWTDAIETYDNAMDYYASAGDKYRDAKELFTITIKYTNNLSYISLCDIYTKLMESASKLTYYLYETSEYMQSACRYYKNGNYNIGGEQIDRANVKIILHDEEVIIYNNLFAELNNILIKL